MAPLLTSTSCIFCHHSQLQPFLAVLVLLGLTTTKRHRYHRETAAVTKVAPPEKTLASRRKTKSSSMFLGNLNPTFWSTEPVFSLCSYLQKLLPVLTWIPFSRYHIAPLSLSLSNQLNSTKTFSFLQPIIENVPTMLTQNTKRFCKIFYRKIKKKKEKFKVQISFFFFLIF